MAPDRYDIRPYTDDMGSGPWPSLPPLPERNHYLTSPSQASSPNLYPQHQPSFLSLPYELRHQVYVDVLGGSNQPVHILRIKDRLTCVRCWLPHGPEVQRHGCLGSKEDFIGCLCVTKCCSAPRPDDVKTGMRGMLELLRTCRFVHAEGLHLLYSEPCFSVNSVDKMMSWKEIVLPSRFNYVRALDLNYTLRMRMRGEPISDAAGYKWRAHWEMVGGMKALKYLRIRLRILNAPGYMHLTYALADTMEILMPLDNVTGPEDFMVIVDWGIKCDEDGHGADHARKRPFRLLYNAGDNEVPS